MHVHSLHPPGDNQNTVCTNINVTFFFVNYRNITQFRKYIYLYISASMSLYLESQPTLLKIVKQFTQIDSPEIHYCKLTEYNWQTAESLAFEVFEIFEMNFFQCKQ